MNPSIVPKGLAVLLAGAVVFCVGFVPGALGIVRLPDVDVTWRNVREADLPRPVQQNDGRELVMIYIGASTCRFSNDERLPAAVKRIKRVVGMAAAENHIAFATQGVARDQDVRNGLLHLRRYGSFDEVASGRGWMNASVRKYLYEDLPGHASTPQVIVIERTFRRDHEALATSEALLVRKAGLKEILSWEQQGTPLPRF